MSNIYAYVIEHEGQIVAQALAEDGSTLVQVDVKHRIYARHELGVTSRKQHGIYHQHDADYRVVDLTACGPEELYQNPDFLDALNRNVLEASVANIPDVPVEEA
jgi:hypothetical protein